MWNIHRAQWRLLFNQITSVPGINVRVNETLAKTVDLKTTSKAANFSKEILSLLAYGGSSIVKGESNLFSHAADG
jgi:hypothetical protein